MFSFCELRVLRLLGTNNLSCKIVKNRILSEVCMSAYRKRKPPHSIYCLPQIWCIKSIDAWLAYTSPDLLARFCTKVNLSNQKIGLDFFLYFGLPFNFNTMCKLPSWLLTHRRWLLSFGCKYKVINSMSDLFYSWTVCKLFYLKII